MLQLYTKNIMHGGLTPSKFICNCNVYLKLVGFGSSTAKLLLYKITERKTSPTFSINFVVCSSSVISLPMTQHPLTDTKPIVFMSLFVRS